MLVAGLLVLLAGCAARRGADGRALSIAGSTSMLPLLEPLAAAFTQATGISVRLNLVGSTAGLVALGAGAADLAAVSRRLSPAEAQAAQAYPIALDGLAVVVHPWRAGVGLTLADLREVLEGGLQRWEQVGGAPGPLRLVLREDGSGTRDALLQIAAPARVRLDALVQGSSGAVLATVAADPDALGIVSTYALDRRVAVVPIAGERPTPKALAAGRYPLVRALWLCAARRGSREAAAFLAYVASPQGQREIGRAGFVPAGGAMHGP